MHGACPLKHGRGFEEPLLPKEVYLLCHVCFNLRSGWLCSMRNSWCTGHPSSARLAAATSWRGGGQTRLLGRALCTVQMAVERFRRGHSCLPAASHSSFYLPRWRTKRLWSVQLAVLVETLSIYVLQMAARHVVKPQNKRQRHG